MFELVASEFIYLLEFVGISITSYNLVFKAFCILSAQEHCCCYSLITDKQLPD